MGLKKDGEKMMNIFRKAVDNPELILPHLFRNLSAFSPFLGRENSSFVLNTINLIINSTCNCSCDFCDVGTKNKSMFYNQMVPDEKSILSFDELNLLLKQFKFIKPFISICGVEPLLHPDIVNVLESLKKKGFPTSVITNGLLLPKYAEEIARIGIRTIKVSIDGPEEMHDSFRGRGVYKKALAGLKILNEAKEKYHTKIKTVINFTITNTNYSYIESFASDVLEKGIVQEVKFNYLYFTSPRAAELHNKEFSHLGESTPTNYQKQFVTKVDTDSIVEQLNTLKKRFKRKIIFNEWLTHKGKLNTYYNFPEEKIDNISCKEPWTGTTILSNSDVVISNRCFEFKTGNIKEQLFKDIWNNERYKKFRAELNKAGQFPVCKRCGGIFYS